MNIDDDDALLEYEHENWSIWNQLLDTRHYWWGIYRTYWGVDGLTRPESLDRVDYDASREFVLAAMLLEIARRLSLDDGIEKRDSPMTKAQESSLRKLLREFTEITVVRDRIALDLAEQSIVRMTGSELRVKRLAGLVRGAGLTPSASKYVKRATALYIAGFDIEAAILCRSALEAALLEACRDHYDEDDVCPNLDALLRIAGTVGLLSGYEVAKSRRGWRSRTNSQLWHAEQLKWLGNHLVHDDPDWETNPTQLADAFDAIRELSRVIGWLFPAS